MTTNIDVTRLTGEWSGTNQLWLAPNEPVRESATQATVTGAAAGQFLVLTYTWSDNDKPHDGVLIIRVAAEPSPVDMVWVDSFHTDGKFMQCEGRRSQEGGLEATAKWSAGEGPDWGWRILLTSDGPDDLSVRMFVATPAGEEAPAVESRYTRGRQAKFPGTTN